MISKDVRYVVDIFKYIFNEYICILIQIPMKFVDEGPIFKRHHCFG